MGITQHIAQQIRDFKERCSRLVDPIVRIGFNSKDSIVRLEKAVLRVRNGEA